MNLGDYGNYSQIASVLIPGIVGLVHIWRKIDKRQSEAQAQIMLMCTKLDSIKEQFGPNGGGLRQAVNEMSHKIDKIEARQQTIGDKVARLSGQFEQHIEEN